MLVLKWFLYVFTQRSQLMRKHVNISLDWAGRDSGIVMALPRPPTDTGKRLKRYVELRALWVSTSKPNFTYKYCFSRFKKPSKEFIDRHLRQAVVLETERERALSQIPAEGLALRLMRRM